MFSTVAVAAWFANQLPLERAIRMRGALRLIAQTLFMPVLLHALASLVFRNLRFASFLQRAHSCNCRSNHLIRRAATHFFAQWHFYIALFQIRAQAGHESS